MAEVAQVWPVLCSRLSRVLHDYAPIMPRLSVWQCVLDSIWPATHASKTGLQAQQPS